MKILGKELHVKQLCLLMALLLIGFSGCSEDEPKPKFEPAPSTSSTSTPPSTPPPTTDPPLKKLSPEETVEAWVEGLNHAFATGDLSQANTFATPDCPACNQSLKEAPDIYAAGGKIINARWSIQGAKAQKAPTGGDEVVAGVTFGSGQTIFEAGAEPVPIPESKQIMYFTMSRIDDAWRVADFGIVG